MREEIFYTPILKGKANDLKALGKVPRTFIPRLSPIIELPSPNEDESIDEAHARFAQQLRKYCPAHTISVDLHTIHPDGRLRDGSLALESLCAFLRGVGLRFVPVYGFDHEPELWDRVASVARRDGRGLTFRLKPEDLDANEDTVADIIGRLKHSGISAADTHLVIDLGSLTPFDGGDLVRLRSACQDFIEAAVSAADFQRVSLAGSSMPRDVGEVPVEGGKTYARRELTLWAEVLTNLPDRAVGYGDYGIVHPSFSDKIIATNANAKIRYTGRTAHHIFRGYNLKKDLRYQQYHELAERVVVSSIYMGRDFSFGDERTWLCAKHEASCGNLGTWVEADMNHHLVCAASQLPGVASLLAQGVNAIEALLAD